MTHGNFTGQSEYIAVAHGIMSTVNRIENHQLDINERMVILYDRNDKLICPPQVSPATWVHKILYFSKTYNL